MNGHPAHFGRRRPGVLAPAILALVAASVFILAPSSLAAPPKTIHGAAYEQMKAFMGLWDQYGFAKAAHLGADKAYRLRLAKCRIVIDPKLKGYDGKPLNGRYGPERNVLYLAKDPRKAKTAADRVGIGNTVWHEITHALEDSHGDDMTNPDQDYQDRHTYYMEYVWRTAVNRLSLLERKAKAGASVAQLRAIWQSYLDKLEHAATQLPETKKYPPDPKLMKAWFGWTASDSDAVRKLYLSNKAFAGKAWKNLRKALSTPALAPGDWGGSWSTLTNGGGLTLTVSGTSVRGVFEYPAFGHEVQGTISADAKTLKGTWLVDTNLVNGPEHRVYEFEVHLSFQEQTGYFVFTGQYWRQDGTGQRFDWEGSRKK